MSTSNPIKRVFNKYILSYSYTEWKVERDLVYYKLDNSLRKDWLSTQHSLQGAIIPSFLSILAIIFSIGLLFVQDLPHTSLILVCILAIYFAWVFTNITLYFIWSDKYTDEKYLEMSKKK